MAGIYVHIPFCKSRCIYCDFYSTTGLEGVEDEYIDCILHEKKLRESFLHDKDIKTIYIGGGTPSVMSLSNLTRLKNGLGDAQEVTVECNPDDMNRDLADTLSNIGVNRVSLGVQTFSDSRLRLLRRRHTSIQVFSAIDILKKAGINNISIDLIFGFPNETMQEWEYDIKNALSLDVQHISAYSLMYEDGTPLHKMLKRGIVEKCDDSLSLAMYEMLIDELAEAGYEQYEISNFARKGFHSRHNHGYWTGEEYLGLGAAAHSYNTTRRQWNVSNVHEYIDRIKNNVIPADGEDIDEVTRYNDIVTTALRTRDGILLSSLLPKYRNYIMENVQKSLANGTATIAHDRLRLTRKGLFVSDDVMSDLIFI